MNASLFVDDLTTHSIPIPRDKDEVLKLREELIASNPQYFGDGNEEADHDWLNSMGLSPMFYYRFSKPAEESIKGCAGAFQMLQDPRMVKFMHALALAGIPLDDIELILNAKYSISYESDDYAMFLKYFANYDNWTYTDKQIYCDEIQDLDLKKIYKTALKGERAKLIWELGLGTDPSLTFDDLLADMFTDSYFYFKKNMAYRADEAQKFAQLAVRISDRLQSLKDKDKDSQSLLSELKFKLDDKSTTKRRDDKPLVIDMNEIDVEMPRSTDESIVDLDKLERESRDEQSTGSS